MTQFLAYVIICVILKKEVITVVNCNRDCFNCVYKDCISSTYIAEEYHLSQSLDKAIIREITPTSILVRRQQSLNWYYRNRDSELQRQAKYREEHREEIREKSRQYHAEHRESDNQRALSNYYSKHEENKKRARDNKRAKYQANKEYYRQKQREYRQRVKERGKQSDTDCNK